MNQFSAESVRRTQVEGARYRLGQPVIILCGDDETADGRFHGRRGVVTGFFVDDVQLVAVQVDDLGEEWFFADELISARERKAPAESRVWQHLHALQLVTA